MKKIIVMLAVVALLALALTPTSAMAYTDACWGQATAATAKTRELGLHASQEETPRLGIERLARQLYKDGVIEAPTLQALGAFLVSIDPDLTVEACTD